MRGEEPMDLLERLAPQRDVAIERAPIATTSSDLSIRTPGHQDSHRPDAHGGAVGGQEAICVSTVFELASVTANSMRGQPQSQQDRMHMESRFKTCVDCAFVPLVQRLASNEALVVIHSFNPDGAGYVELSTRLQVERRARPTGEPVEDARKSWSAVLRTSLAMLSDTFSFREARTPFVRPDNYCRYQLQTKSVTLHGRKVMGFTGDNGGRHAIVLPVLVATDGPAWPTALERTFKAARVQDIAVTLGMRISRVVLDPEQREVLHKLDVSAAGAFVVTATGEGLLNTAEALARHEGDFIRVEMFVEFPLSEAHEVNAAVGPLPGGISALLEVFAHEVLPNHPVKRQIESGNLPEAMDSDAASSELLDLSTVVPFSGSLPPLLPKPELMQELDFARHYTNQTIRLPNRGLLLGTAQIGGFERTVRMPHADRSRHLYVLGGTGTGKSMLLFNMIKQDMLNGRGLGLVDPHGDLFERVLANVPAHRVDDVVIIDPSDSDDVTVGLNPLDFGDHPSLFAVNRVIGDLLEIFEQLYDMKLVGGPGFEQHFRNSMLLAASATHESPGTRSGKPTFKTVLELLRNKDWREYLLNNAKSTYLGEDMGSEVVAFFEAAEATNGEQSFANWVPYISNKLTRFTNNPLLRSMLCSSKRTVDFRDVMDNQQILLVNLGKGSIGPLDSSMIGMLVSKGLFAAALSRADLPKDKRISWTYYLDEFQNFVTPDVAEMLAEARKYGLQLCLAHQTLGQLLKENSRSVLDAVLGNTATKLLFRLGIEEATILEQSMHPQIDRFLLAQLPDRQIAARLLLDNKVSAPFVFNTINAVDDRAPEEQQAIANLVRQRSMQKYGLRTDGESIEINTPEGESASVDPSAEPSSDGHLKRAPEVQPVVLRGHVCISGNISAKDCERIDRSTDESLAMWKQLVTRPQPVLLKPETGRCYITGNQSLVVVTTMDGDGNAKAVVIKGGHKQQGIRGAVPGSIFNLRASGEFASDAATRILMGMSLEQEFPAPNLKNFFASTVEKPTFAWLTSETDRPTFDLNFAGARFYETLNGSLVFVLPKAKPDGERRAIVLKGGHAVEELNGTKALESFTLDRCGRYILSSTKAKETAAAVLAAASGMSIARRFSVPEITFGGE